MVVPAASSWVGIWVTWPLVIAAWARTVWPGFRDTKRDTGFVAKKPLAPPHTEACSGGGEEGRFPCALRLPLRRAAVGPEQNRTTTRYVCKYYYLHLLCRGGIAMRANTHIHMCKYARHAQETLCLNLLLAQALHATNPGDQPNRHIRTMQNINV